MASNDISLNLECESGSSSSSDSDSSDSDQEALTGLTEQLKNELGLHKYWLEPRKPGYMPSNELDYEPISDSDTDLDENQQQAVAGAESPAASEDEDENPDRIGHTDWCSCGNCVVMPSGDESKCCSEEQESARFRPNQQCVVDYAGFESVCLIQDVLDVAYYAYKEHAKQNGKVLRKFGTSKNEINRKYRWVAYRQYVRWVYGYLGDGVRLPLPSCATEAIHKKYPKGDDEEYTRFSRRKKEVDTAKRVSSPENVQA